jgi:hypothetical protein
MRENPALQVGSTSFYRRAQAKLSEGRESAERLLPLTDSPSKDLNVLRSVVRSKLDELIEEFATAGGPRIARVDHLFTMLLGQPHRAVPSKINGSIGDLGIALGEKQESVNTVDDEQNLTNFRIIADYVISLLDSWEAHKQSPRP